MTAGVGLPADAPGVQVSVAKLGAAVDKLVDQVRTRVADAPEDTRSVLLDLLARLDDPPREAALVVVGETKKGKSSLVNALVGRPGLSPVAVDVATATYVFFRHGATETVTVFPADSAAPEGETVGVDDLAAWVTVDGLAANPRVKASIGDEEIVTARPVLVALSTPLLEQMAIIDTPGVGGLVGEHAGVTRTAVHLASAMLFVTEVTAPLTTNEVQFLDELSGQVGDVVIALNMADKLTADELEAAVADARRKIAERLPRYRDCPLVTVSARNAEQANDPGLPEPARTLLRRRAGMGELERVLHERVGRRGALLDQVVRLRVVADVADALATTWRSAEAAAGGTRTLAQVKQEQIRLQGDVNDSHATLAHGLGQLQRTLGLHLDGRMRALRTTAGERAQRHERVADLARSIDAELAVVAAELADLLAQGMRSAIVDALGEALDDPLFATAADTALAEAAGTVDFRAALPETTIGLGPDGMFQASLGAMTGVGLASLVAGEAATSALVIGSLTFPPLAAIFAGVIVGANLLVSKRRMQVTQTSNWVTSRIDQGYKDMLDAVPARIAEATYVLGGALRTWSRLRADVLREEQSALERPASRPGQIGAAGLAMHDCERIAGEARSLMAVATPPRLEPAPLRSLDR